VPQQNSRRALEPAVDVVRKAAVELHGSARDYDALLERVGDAHYVLLGEASHGTHEFYRQRGVRLGRARRTQERSTCSYGKL
jgi:erythromycin esterase-like protein